MSNAKIVPLWVVIVAQIIAAILEHRSHQDQVRDIQFQVDLQQQALELTEANARDALASIRAKDAQDAKDASVACRCLQMDDAERAAVIEKEHLKRNGVIKPPGKPVGDVGSLPKPPPLPKPDPDPRPWRGKP